MLTEFFVEDSVVLGYDAAPVSDVSKKCDGFIFKVFRNVGNQIAQKRRIISQNKGILEHTIVKISKLEFYVTIMIEKFDRF